MAIGERIHFFRLLRGMTQKYLGTAVGFPERSADVRLAQYETGSRKPKADLTAALAQVLEVSPQALDVPDIDSYIGLMHTLFTLEDIYGLTVSEADGEVCLKVNKDKGKDAAELSKMLCALQSFTFFKACFLLLCLCGNRSDPHKKVKNMKYPHCCQTDSSCRHILHHKKANCHNSGNHSHDP